MTAVDEVGRGVVAQSSVCMQATLAGEHDHVSCRDVRPVEYPLCDVKGVFPANFRAYEQACKRGEVQVGHMLITTTVSDRNPKWIVNFPTKRHWRNKSRLEDIESGLVSLAQDIRRLDIHSIAIPPLGCGLGGLDWTDVRPKIEHALGALRGVRVIVFEPGRAPAVVAKAPDAPRMTPGRAVLVGLMERYLAGLMDPFVSLLEVHKLMYLSQEAGEPLKLEYVKGHYGPYAKNLRHVLHKIEGHFVTGYADGGDDPTKQLELVPGASDAANEILSKQHLTARRFERVVDLVDGFETPFGMELLATVHWVARHEGARSASEAIAAVHRWSDRKQQFSAKQISTAWSTLDDKGWLRAS